MKKIVSVLIMLCLLLVSMSAFAAGEDKVFEALGNTAYSGEFDMEFKAELNEPLLIAEVLEENLFGADHDVPVDLKMLLEGILSSEIKAKGQYNISRDYKKADIYMSYTFSNPININESLKIAAWSKWDMWMQYDFASEIPVYRMIYKIPFLKDYTVVDMGEQLKNTPMAIADMMPDAESVSSIQEKVVTLYKDNTKVSGSGDNYSLKIDDNSYKNIFIGIFDIMSEFIYEQNLKSGMPEDVIEETSTIFDEITKGIDNSRDKFSILGNDGINMDITINPLGFISESKASIHVCLNIYDIMNAFDGGDTCGEMGITKENSNIDFTINLTESMSSHNQDVKVQYPELTEENSYDVMSDIIYDTDYVSRYKYFDFIEEGTPVIENDISYVNLKKISEQCGFDFSFEDGVVYVDTKTSLGTFEFTLDSNLVLNSGETFELDSPVIEKDGEVYVNASSIWKLNMDIYGIYYHADTNETNIYGVFEDPDFVESEETVVVEEISEPSPYFSVSTDKIPVIKDGVIYIPFYPLMGEFNVGAEEINVSDGEVLVQSEKAYGFNTLKVYENSVLSEKDGEKILLENPVLNIDGSYWVGTDFVENVLNSDFTGMNVYYSNSASYDFERK